MATIVSALATSDDAPTDGTRPPFQLADIYRLRLVSQPAVSPEGQQIAFVMYGLNQATNEPSTTIWLAPSDGSAPAWQLTRGGQDGAPAWSPDGRTIAFLSTRPASPAAATAHGKSPAEARQQIWLLDVAGGEPRQATSRAEGVHSFDWAPDSRRLVFAGRDPSEVQERYLQSIRGELEGAGGEQGPLIFNRVQHKFDGYGYLDEVRTHLFVVDTASGEERRLTDGPCDEIGPPRASGGPRWSPQGNWVAFVSNRTGDSDNNHRVDLWLVSPDGRESRRLTFGDVAANEPRWAPDGKSLAFLSWRTPDDTAWATRQLCWVSLEQAEPVANLAACVGQGWSSVGGIVPAELTGDPVAQARVAPVADRQTPMRVLTGNLDCPVEGPPVWVDNEHLLVPISERGRTKLAHASLTGDARIVYPLGEQQVTLHEIALGNGTLAMSVNAPEGTDLFVLDAADLVASGSEPAPRQRTRVNQTIFAERAPVQYMEIAFANSAGDSIAGFVVAPAGFDPDEGPLPLVLLPHGGPMGFDPPALQFYEHWFTGEAFLASMGYLVLMVNYRGSTSYGEDFCWSIRSDLGHREADDILSGVQYLIEQGWADPARLFITGCSYGGYLTAWVTGTTDWFQAAVSELPAWDMYRSFGASDLHASHQWDHGLVWHNRESYARSSPSSHVLNVTTPTLIMAGEHDWRCPAILSEAYYLTLKKIGVPTELVIYQNEHHALTRPRRTVDRMARICRWFANYGGLPFADTSAEGYPDQR